MSSSSTPAAAIASSTAALEVAESTVLRCLTQSDPSCSQLLLGSSMPAAFLTHVCAHTHTHTQPRPLLSDLSLEYDFTPEQREQFEQRAADAHALLASGLRESGSKSATLTRFLEGLASSLAPLDSRTSRTHTRLSALYDTLIAMKAERASAVVPFVRPLTVASADDTARPSKRVALEVLQALESAWTQTHAHAHSEAETRALTQALAPMLTGLQELLAEFAPGSLFSEWSPARLPAEVPLQASHIPRQYDGAALDVDPRRTFASHTSGAEGSSPSGADIPVAAASGGMEVTPQWSAGAWRSDRVTSSSPAIWGITFATPQPVSSIRIFWAGGAPRSVSVEVTTDPLPDPLAERTAVSCAVSDLSAAATAGSKGPALILLPTPASTQTGAVVSELVTSSNIDADGRGITATAAAADITTSNVVRVTWRSVAQHEVADAEVGGADDAASASCSHVIVGGCPSGACARITGLRLVMRGQHRNNARKQIGFAGIQFLTLGSVRSPAAGDILDRIQQLAHMAVAVSQDSARTSEDDALCAVALKASLSVALASGRQAALIRYTNALLRNFRVDSVDSIAASDDRLLATATASLGAHKDALCSALKPLRQGIEAALESYSSRVAAPEAKAGLAAVDLQWDAAAANGSGLEYSNGNKTVNATNYGNALAVANQGFSEGIVTWEMVLEQDSNDDEHSCFGMTSKPISSASYESSHVWMYRAYNAELYGSGKTSGSRKKIHPNNRVKIQYDADAGIISFWVDDEPQGECFRGLKGRELFPAVAFYSSNVKIAITKCEWLSTKAKAAPATVDGTPLERAIRASLALTGALPAGAPAGAAAADEDPEPVRPSLSPEFDEDAQRAAHPLIETVVSMGFHWAQAAAALRATSDNIEQAMDRLLNGSVSEDAITTAEAAQASFATELSKWERAHRDWEARQAAAAKETEEAVAAAAAGASSAAASDDPTKTAHLATLEAPSTLLEGAAAVMGVLERLTAAYVPRLLPGGLPAVCAPAARTVERVLAEPTASKSGAAKPGLPGSRPRLGRASSNVPPPPPDTVHLADLPPVTSQLTAVPIYELHGLQADRANFHELNALLQWLLRCRAAALRAKQATVTRWTSSILLAVLRIIRGNLSRLTHANVSVDEVGLSDAGAAASLSSLHAALYSLMDAGVPDELQQAAVAVVDAGLTVLYPTPNARAALLTKLLDAYTTAPDRMSRAQQDLLSRCLAFFASTRGIVSLLPPASRTLDPSSSIQADQAGPEVESILSFVRVLLSIASTDTKRRLQDSSASASGSPTGVLVGEKTAELLSAFQRHLISVALEEVAAADRAAKAGIVDGFESKHLKSGSVDLVSQDVKLLDARLASAKWVPGMSAAATPACMVLVQYATTVLRTCAELARCATEVLEVQHVALAYADPSDESVSSSSARRDVEPDLRRSIVGQVLPGVVGGVALLGSQPWLAVAILPDVVSCAKRMDDMTGALSRVQGILRQSVPSSSDAAAGAAESPDVARFIEYQLLQHATAAASMIVPPPPTLPATYTDLSAVADSRSHLHNGFVTLPGSDTVAEIAIWMPKDSLKSTSGSGDDAAAEWSGTGITALPWSSVLALCTGKDASEGTQDTLLQLRSASSTAAWCHTEATFCRKVKTGVLSGTISIQYPTLVSPGASVDSPSVGMQKLVLHVAGCCMGDGERTLIMRCHPDKDVAATAGAALMTAAGAAAGVAAALAKHVPPVDLTATASSPARAAAIWPAAVAASLSPEAALRAVRAGIAQARAAGGRPAGRAAGDGCGAEGLLASRTQCSTQDTLWPAHAQRLLVFAGARMSATLAAGPHVSYEEEQLKPLLRSHLLSGGVRFSTTSRPGSLPYADVAALPLLWPVSEEESERVPLGCTDEFVAILDDGTADADELLAGIGDGIAAAEAVRSEAAPSTAAARVYLWLQANTAEPAVKRRMGIFPEAEIPYLFALITHSDALDATRILASQLRAGRVPPTAQAPPEIASAWQEVMLLRAYLRGEKKRLASAQPPPPVDDDTGATKQSASAARKLRPTTPHSFVQVLDGIRERAWLLLCVAPPRLPTGALPPAMPKVAQAASSGLSRSLSALSERLMMSTSGLGATDAADAIDALQGGGGGALALPGALTMLGRQTSFLAVTSEEGSASPAKKAGGGSDSVSLTSSQMAIVRTARTYVRYGVGAPPALVARVLLWRVVRGAARVFALRAFDELVSACSQVPQAVSDVLVHLRTPTRGVLERLSDSMKTDSQGRTDASTDRAWLLRHHYAQHLEALPAELSETLHAAQVGLQARLQDRFVQACERRDVREISLLLWTWSSDVPASDHEALLQSHMVERIAAQASVSVLATAHEDDGSDTDANAAWHPWPLADVLARMVSGTLSQRDVLHHIAMAPAAATQTLHGMAGPASGAEWLVRHTGTADVDVLAAKLRVAAVMDLYSKFTQPVGTTAAADVFALPAATEPSVPLGDAVALASVFAGLPSVPRALHPEEARANEGAAAAPAVSAASTGAAAGTRRAVMATVADGTSALDTQRRKSRPAPVRRDLHHPRHAAHALTEMADSSSRFRTMMCSVCSTRLRENGSTCWSCAGCNFDVCARCFASRPGAEAWEAPPVSDLRATFDGPAPVLVPGSPVANQPLYVDQALAVEGSIPWIDAASRLNFHTIRTPRHGGSAPASAPAISFNVTRPVRVWLLVPQMHLSASGVVASGAASWVAERFETMPGAGLGFRRQLAILRGKQVFVPPATPPPWSAGHILPRHAEVTLPGLGSGREESASWNYAVMLETLAPEDVTIRDVFGVDELPAVDDGAAQGKYLPRVSIPVRPVAIIQRACWSSLRVLALLLASEGYAEADGAATGGATTGLRLPAFLAPAGAAPPDPAGALPPAPPALLPSTSVITRDTVGPARQATATASLRAWLFQYLNEQLQSAAGAFTCSNPVLNHGGAAASAPPRVDALQAEALAFQVLQFLFSICDTPSAKIHVSSGAYVATLLSLFLAGSPRVQRLAARLISSVASRLEPAVVETALQHVAAPTACAAWRRLSEISSSSCSTPTFFGMLLDIVALPTLAAWRDRASGAESQCGDVGIGAAAARAASAASSGSSNSHTFAFGVGDIAQAAASEAVALVRTLLQFHDWRAPLLAAFASLLRVSVPADGDAERTTALVGALAVMGGFIEPLRVGARVLVSNARIAFEESSAPVAQASTAFTNALDMTATVVRLPKPGETRAQVVYGTELSSAPSFVEVQRLLPVPLVPAPVVALVEGTTAALTTLLASSSAKARGASTALAERCAAMACGVLLASPPAPTLGEATPLLQAMFDAALQPMPYDNFVSLPALTARCRAIEARAIEVRPRAWCTAPAQAASATVKLPSWHPFCTNADAINLGRSRGVAAVVAAAALEMHGGSAASAGAWLREQMHPAWATRTAWHSAYAGYSHMRDDDRGRVFARVAVQPENALGGCCVHVMQIVVPRHAPAGAPPAVRDAVAAIQNAVSGYMTPELLGALEAAVKEAPSQAFASLVTNDVELRGTLTAADAAGAAGVTGVDGDLVLVLTDSRKILVRLSDAAARADLQLPAEVAAEALENAHELAITLHAVYDGSAASAESLSDSAVLDLAAEAGAGASRATAEASLLVPDSDLLAFGRDVKTSSAGGGTPSASPTGGDGATAATVLPLPAAPATCVPLVPMQAVSGSISQKLKTAFARGPRDGAISSVAEVEFTITLGAHRGRSPMFVGLATRAQRPNYHVGQQETTLSVSSAGARWSNGSSVDLPAGSELHDGDHLRFVNQGECVKVYRNGELLTTFTDTPVDLLPAVTLSGEGDSVTILRCSPPGVHFEPAGRGTVSSALTVSEAGHTVLLEESDGGWASATAAAYAAPSDTADDAVLAAELLERAPSAILAKAGDSPVPVNAEALVRARSLVLARVQEVYAAHRTAEAVDESVFAPLGTLVPAAKSGHVTVTREPGVTLYGVDLATPRADVRDVLCMAADPADGGASAAGARVLASATFAVGARFSVFEAVVSVAGDASSADGCRPVFDCGDDAGAGLAFEVLCDGKVAWSSALVREPLQLDVCSVRVHDAQRVQLRLVVQSKKPLPSSINWANIVGIWSGATFVGRGPCGLPAGALVMVSGREAMTLSSDLFGANDVGYTVAEAPHGASSSQSASLRLRRVNLDTGVVLEGNAAPQACYLVRRIHGVPCADADASEPVAWNACRALTVAMARHVLPIVLLSWCNALDNKNAASAPFTSVAAAPQVPPALLSPELAAGPKLLSLLKLVVSADSTTEVSAAASGVAKSSVSATTAAADHAKVVSAADAARAYVGSPAAQAGTPTAAVLQHVLTRLAISESAGSKPLGIADKLVEDCLWHLAGATRPPYEHVHNVSSVHPLPPGVRSSGSFSTAGAVGTAITFHPRCSTPSGTKLSFYSSADKASASLLHTVNGGGVWPKRVELAAERVWWQLHVPTTPDAESSDGVAEHWGVAFAASPLAAAWKSDAHALAGTSSSVSWACWLLRFLLTDVAGVLQPGVVHNQRTFDALVTVLRDANASLRVRARVLQLLSQLLVEHSMFHDVPNLDSLKGVEEAVVRAAEKGIREGGSTSKFLPQRLQELIELVVARRAAIAAITMADAISRRRAGGGAGGTDADGDFPGDGIGIALWPERASAGSASAPPLLLNFDAVRAEFAAAYPEIADSLLGSELRTRWADMTSSCAAGVLTWAAAQEALPGPELRVMKALMLYFNPSLTSSGVADAAVPNTARFDLYDFFTIVSSELMSRVSGASTPSAEHQAYACMEKWLEWAEAELRAHEVAHAGRRAGGEPAVVASTDEPPRAVGARVLKPWLAPALPLERAHLHAGLLATEDTVRLAVVRPTAAPHVELDLRTLVPARMNVLYHAACTAAAAAASSASSSTKSGQASLRLRVVDSAGMWHAAVRQLQPADAVLVVDFDPRRPASTGLLRALAASSVPIAVLLPADDVDEAARAWVAARSAASPDASRAPSEIAVFALVPAAAAQLAAVSGGATSPTASHAAGGAAAMPVSDAHSPAESKPDNTTVGLPAYTVPTKASVVKSLDGLNLVDALMFVHEISSFLLSGTRPRDEIMCSAWLEAVGTRKVIESVHPFAPEAAMGGKLVLEGATSLRVTFDARCQLPPGASLVLTAGDGTRTFSGAPVTASGAAAASEWLLEPVTFTGSTLRYEVRSTRAATGHPWGVSFTVSAQGMRSAASTDLLAAHASDIPAAFADMARSWSPSMDAALVDLARRVVDSVNATASASGSSDRVTLSNLPLEHVVLSDEVLRLRFPALGEVPTEQLRIRFALMRMLNAVVRPCLPCFALESQSTGTLGNRMARLNYAVFREMKQGVLDSVMASTAGRSSYSGVVSFSNFKASESAERGDIAPETSQCMFVQAFEQLKSVPSVNFRSIERSDQARVFQTRFDGEDGIDAGGVYREALSRMIDDLFSERFSLLLRCGNAQKGFQVNTSSYVPNPELRTPLALTMFEFLGRFMGMSMRSKASLPFAFPSIVWKALIGHASTSEDLYLMDAVFAQFLASIRHCDRDVSATGEAQTPILTEEAFAAAFPDLRFVTLNTAGVEVELMEGGRDVPVTFANRLRYVEAAERARLHEFDVQLEAIRRGFGNVIPLRALSLFTWQECEVLVAGDPEIDVEYLKRNTVYEGYSATDDVIERFWRVMRGMSREERSNYIRFVWGRARLPTDESGWTSKHKITRIGGETGLPMAHTCFCTVDLPPYTTDERMRWGLVTAATYGLGAILNR